MEFGGIESPEMLEGGLHAGAGGPNVVEEEIGGDWG